MCALYMFMYLNVSTLQMREAMMYQEIIYLKWKLHVLAFTRET